MGKWSVWGLAILVVSLGIFSFLGSASVGWLYLGLIIPIATFHYFYSCRRCTNVECAINSASEAFFLGKPRREILEDAGFSDLNAAVAGLPLVFAVGVGLYGTFAYRWEAFVVSLVLLAVAGAGYTKTACAGCTNDCPANRNAEYREWKTGKDEESI